MVNNIVYLKPLGPLHLQTGGGDHESVESFPRSDTLSAALSYWWFRQYGEIPGFPKTLPYHHSSLFPAIKNDNGIQRLYPKPTNIKLDPESQHHKVFKNIRWVDEKLHRLWLSGEQLEKLIPEHSSSPNLKRNGEVWVHDPEVPTGSGPLVTSDVRTRTTVDRVTGATVPFHFVSAVYASDVLFWFYLTVTDEAKHRFLGMLRLLGDEGLGADRTIGMGRFAISSIDSWNQESTQEASEWFNMGVYNPIAHEVQEIDWSGSHYLLETRSGWVSGTAIRRKPILCVAENSLIALAQKPQGHIVCVFDKDEDVPGDVAVLSYSVYRDCRGFFLPRLKQG